METALEQLRQYLQQPGTPPPSRAELEALCTRYPWFAAPYAVLCSAYADELSDSELLALRQRHAVLTAGCTVGGDDASQAPVATASRRGAGGEANCDKEDCAVIDSTDTSTVPRRDAVATEPLAPPQFAPPLPVVPPPFTGLAADDEAVATPPPFTGFDIDEDPAVDLPSVATGHPPVATASRRGASGDANCGAGSNGNTDTADTSIAPPRDAVATVAPVTESAEPSATDQVLSTYFATFGHTTAEEDALLERMIFNPQPDYASVLMQQEAEVAAATAVGKHADAAPAGGTRAAAVPATGSHADATPAGASHPDTAPATDSHADATPAYAGHPDAAPAVGSPAAVQMEGGSAAGAPSSVPTGPSARQSADAAELSEVAQALKPQRTSDRPKQAADSSLLSESLAKIFIKQGRYDRAYEIISNLNLNYPEKSVYFADQLRFLRKLMHLQAVAQQAQENHGE